MSSHRPPRVSVVVRTKDRTRLLARALDDIIAQNFDDWELVVVNDGGSPAAVDELIGARPELRVRARVVHNTHSLGMEAASNAGVAVTRGDYIAVHDDDDTWAPDFLSETVAWLEEHGDHVGVVAATEIVIERLDAEDVVELRRLRFHPKDDIVTAFDLIVRNQFVPISLLVRRSAVEALGGFDPSLPVVGDWDFHLRLALSGDIGFLDGPARAFWHQRPASADELANSVHSAEILHRQFDRRVRDRALREWVAREGIGSLLYLGKVIDERTAEAERHTYETLHAAIDAQNERFAARDERLRTEIGDAIHYYALGPTIKRNWKRLLRGFR